MSFWDFMGSSTPAGVASSAAQGLATGILGGIDKIIRDFKLPPEQMVAFESRMAELKAQTDQAILQFESQVIQTVNQTMQAESKSEHWLQWSWRPLNGYALALGSFAAVLFTLWACYQAVILKDANALLALPAIVTSITMVLAIPGAVCGVTAWHRGMKQIEQIKEKP